MNKAELATELRAIVDAAGEADTYTASARLSTRLTTCLPLVRWHLGDGFVDELARAGERAKGLEREQAMLPYDPDLDDSAKALVLKVGWESFARTEGVDLCAIASVLEQADIAQDARTEDGIYKRANWFTSAVPGKAFSASTLNAASGEDRGKIRKRKKDGGHPTYSVEDALKYEAWEGYHKFWRSKLERESQQ